MKKFSFDFDGLDFGGLETGGSASEACHRSLASTLDEMIFSLFELGYFRIQARSSFSRYEDRT